MKISGRCWAPRTVDRLWMPLLAVPVRGNPPMDQELHRSLMLQKVEVLVEEAGLEGARAALEMSAEHAPEMWAIASNELERFWPIAILNSDRMAQRLRMIDWSKEGRGRPVPQAEIKEALREQSLASMLETL